MGLARYEIVPVGKQWAVRHDGVVNLEYSTKESAFESLAAAASLAIREGHEVQISVPGEGKGKS
jgi:phosphotransferase system HPr-like phosphotransfer protein